MHLFIYFYLSLLDKIKKIDLVFTILIYIYVRSLIKEENFNDSRQIFPRNFFLSYPPKSGTFFNFVSALSLKPVK